MKIFWRLRPAKHPGCHWRHCFRLLRIGLLILGAVACRPGEAGRITPAFITHQSKPTAEAPSPVVYDNIHFDHLELEEGLSESAVSSILQDRQGFLWVGTFDGLNRYDGNQFITYKYHANDPQSLSGNLVFELHEANNGLIWIATQGNGVSYYDPDTARFTRFRHQEGDPSSLGDNFVQDILEDREGNIWFGTARGLDRLDLATGQFEHFRNAFSAPESAFDSNLIETLVEDADGRLWLGTRNGLLIFDPTSRAFQRHDLDPANPQAQTVGNLFIDDQERLWVCTLAGLYLVDPDTLEWRIFNPDPSFPDGFPEGLVSVVHQDPAGVFWLGTANGLYRWDLQAERYQHFQYDPDDPHSLQQPVVHTIYTDRSGILWVGGNEGGLSRFDPWQHKFRHIEPGGDSPANGLSQAEIWAMAEDQSGRIWIGHEAGLDRWDRRQDAWRYFHANPDDPEDWLRGGVQFIAVVSDGSLWMATGQGLVQMDPDTGELLAGYHQDPADPHGMYPVSTTYIYEDTTGMLWLGSLRQGLSKFDRAAERFTHYQLTAPGQPTALLGENTIWSISEDRREAGRLWLATSSGLAKYQDGRFQFYRHNPDDLNSPSHDTIYSIYQDAQGVLWLGTADGLNRFEPASGNFYHYHIEDGLLNNRVYSILADEHGYLWLSTNRGLSRLDLLTENFRNFDAHDGLLGTEFGSSAALRSSSGELFFGSEAGINIFDSQLVADNPYKPPVLITDLSILNKPVPIAANSILRKPIYRSQMLELGPKDSVFTFELATLHYAAPADNQYAYIMEGFDEAWNLVGNRHYATYTNLPPGSYTFRAIGSNSDGIWNETGTSIQVVVHPPWWGTWWFRSLLLLALVGLVAGGYQWRVSAIRARRDELATQVTARTRELAAVYAIAAMISSSREPEETLSAALSKTLEIMACQVGGIHFLDKSQQNMTLVTHQAINQECQAKLGQMLLKGSFLEDAVQTGRPQVIQKNAPLIESILCKPGFKWLAVTPLVARGKVLGTFFVTSRQRLPLSDRGLELLVAIGNQIGLSLENARFIEAEHMRAEQLELINEVGRHFTSILDIDQVLEQVVQLIRQTFGYYHVGLGLVEGDEVVYRVGAGPLWDDPDFGFRPARLKVGKEGLAGAVAGSGQPLLVPDVSQEERYVWMEGSLTRSELTVPIMVKENIIGVLDLQSDRLNHFDETDQAIMQALANQAGIAIENARLYEQAQQLAIVEERNRLARDLHDSVTQSIYSLTLLAEAGQRMIRAGDMAQIEQNQARLGSIAQHALQEMRLLVYELRPLDLREAGIVAALEQRLEVVERRAGVEALLRVSDGIRLSEAQEDVLYRVAHEALNNALKHADASRVCVTLQGGQQGILMEINDNGQGFEMALAGYQGGLGLVSMRERVEQIGGRLKINSIIGQGTTIRVEAPSAERRPRFRRPLPPAEEMIP